MMNRKYILLCVVLALFANCREKYILPDVGPAGGFLVVEGVINSGGGKTTIKLSRSVKLSDDTGLDPEKAATVYVQGKDLSQQPLIETGIGVYTNDQLNINPAQQYRLVIKTNGGKEYLSDYTTVIKTPPVDGINWQRKDGGVELFVNTHSTTGLKYYRWDFDETWEFHSKFFSLLKYVYNARNEPVEVADRTYAESLGLYTCWKTEPSTSLLLGSTAQLARDSIHLPIHFISPGSWRLSVKYSINVKQYALSADEYEFLRRMKKNTEQLGSLFDAQPSELKGNIRCVNNPNELVIGFVGVADVTEKRIFIDKSEVPDWQFFEDCEETDIPNIPDTLQAYSGSVPTVVTQYRIPGPGVARLNVSTPYCVDCTVRGSNQKPPFWP